MLWSAPSVINTPIRENEETASQSSAQCAPEKSSFREKRGNDLTRPLVQFVLLPPVAYLLYLALEAVVHLAYWLFHAETLRQQFGVLGAVLMLFLVIAEYGAWKGKDRSTGVASTSLPMSARKEDGVELLPAPTSRTFLKQFLHHLPRHTFHLFALIGFFCLPLAARSPSLLLLAAIIWSLELFVAWRASHRTELSRTESD